MQLISLALLVSSAFAAPHIGPRTSKVPFAGTPAAFRSQGPSRTFARPTGLPPTNAQLIAQAAGTFEDMGYILLDGTFQPTYDEDKDAATAQRLRQESAPFYEFKSVATENDRIFNITSLKGENGFCGMAGENLSCAFEEPQSGLRFSSTTYGWEVTVAGAWWWWDFPAKDDTTPRVLHTDWFRAENRAPLQLIALPSDGALSV